jgi:CubicO group peptidase (beta-lactamase class C family)
MQTARVPGLAVAVLRDGELAGVRAFGVRDATTRDPVRTGTVFEAASLSKVVTAYVALRLVERGKLGLDTPLVTYAASPCDANEPLAAKITLRHALTHSTGFRNWRFNKDEKLTIDFEPGSRFSYSGEGILWVERAIEAASGAPFARHVQETLFAPLGMANSSFVWRSEFEAAAARGHDQGGQVSESWVMKLARKADETGRAKATSPLDWTYDEAERALIEAGFPPLPTMVTPNAAGSLFTTAGEYAVFFARVLERRARDAASLPDDLRAMMRSPQIHAAGLASWGLGVGLETDRQPPSVWHWGDSGPATTFALGDPVSGRAVVVFTNGSRGLRLCERITQEVMESGPRSSFLFI